MKKIFVPLLALLSLTVAQAAHFSNEDSACGDSSCLDSYEKQPVQLKKTNNNKKEATSKQKNSSQVKDKTATK